MGQTNDDEAAANDGASPNEQEEDEDKDYYQVFVNEILKKEQLD